MGIFVHNPRTFYKQRPAEAFFTRRVRMDTLFWMAVATVVVVLIFDYTNGFHDAANIVATVIASRAMTPVQAVLIVGFFEFMGPLLGGTAVANTIGKFVDLNGVDPQLAVLIMFCGCSAPSSGTWRPGGSASPRRRRTRWSAVSLERWSRQLAQSMSSGAFAS
jgi:hypothetical protein